MNNRRPGGSPDEGESLVAVLVALGAVPRSRAEEIERFARGMSKDEILGELLLRRGLIRAETLKEALRVRRDLSSPNPRTRALAAASLAARSAESVRELAGSVRETVRRSERSRGSSEYSTVSASTSNLLEKGSKA